MDPKTMTPFEFTLRIREIKYADDAVREMAARDAALVQKVLDGAYDRAREHVRCRRSETCTCFDGLRAAIMGTKPLVKGMVVRHKGTGAIEMIRDVGGKLNVDAWQPVKGHADADGNLFVDEEN